MKSAVKLIKGGLIFSGIFTALFLSGCAEKPLDSLKKYQPSVSFPESFWQKEQKANTDLWKQAVEICTDQNYKSTLNCGYIHDIQMFANPLPYHKYGSGKGFGKVSLNK